MPSMIYAAKGEVLGFSATGTIVAVGVGVAVGSGEGVAVGSAVGVAVGVGVGVVVGVGDGVAVAGGCVSSLAPETVSVSANAVSGFIFHSFYLLIPFSGIHIVLFVF